MREATVSETKVVAKFKDFQLVLLIAALLALLIAIDRAVVLAPLIDLPLATLRVLCGLAFVFYLPGYSLTAAFFIRFDELDLIERLGLSFGLSLAWLSILALILDQLPWGLQQWPIYLGELFSILSFITVAGWRRNQQPPAAVYSPSFAYRPRPWWRSLPLSNKRIYQFCFGIALLAVASIAYIFIVPPPDAFLTEFFVLSERGLTEAYPQEAAVGQPLSVNVGVVNRERTARDYSAEIWVVNPWESDQRQRVGVVDTVTLEQNQSQEFVLNWSMPWEGNDQYVDLLLFTDGQDAPYRKLRLWLNVTR